MYGFIIVIHVVICILLVAIILMQSGRGGGLTESFSAAESMFGAKTNSVLIKGTTIMAIVFLTTCLSLAFLSTKKNQSLITEQSIGHQESSSRSIPVDSEDIPVEASSLSSNDAVEDEKEK